MVSGSLSLVFSLEPLADSLIDGSESSFRFVIGVSKVAGLTPGIKKINVMTNQNSTTILKVSSNTTVLLHTYIFQEGASNPSCIWHTVLASLRHHSDPLPPGTDFERVVFRGQGRSLVQRSFQFAANKE